MWNVCQREGIFFNFVIKLLILNRTGSWDDVMKVNDYKHKVCKFTNFIIRRSDSAITFKTFTIVIKLVPGTLLLKFIPKLFTYVQLKTWKLLVESLLETNYCFMLRAWLCVKLDVNRLEIFPMLYSQPILSSLAHDQLERPLNLPRTVQKALVKALKTSI